MFDRFLAALFGSAPPPDAQEQGFIDELTDLIVDTVEPRVRAHRKYRQELAPGVRATVAYLRELGRLPLPPLTLARADWNSDPRLNAFFARAEDIPAFLGRSKELRAFFDANAGAEEAFALLALKQEEKTVLDPQEVARKAVVFTGHRLLAPAATEAETRLEVGRRIILRLAHAALARIVEIDRAGVSVEQRKAYLATLVRVLKLARDGGGDLVEDPAALEAKIEVAERELQKAVQGFIETKGLLATLDGYIAQIDQVFSQPAQHAGLALATLRLSRMNIEMPPDSAEPAQDVPLARLRVGDRLDAVIAVVRCPRAELPAREDLLAQAERFL